MGSLAGSTLSLCCKETTGAEEELLLSARFDGMRGDGLVSVAKGDNDFPEDIYLSPLDRDQLQIHDDPGGVRGPIPTRDVDTCEGRVTNANSAHRPPMPSSAFGLEGLTPKGELCICKDIGKLDSLEIANLERLVAKLAGSPLGCIDFENTFRRRHTENHIVALRHHELDGATFGEVCGQYSKVTILGLKNNAGKAIWAPAPYIRLHSSDELLLIECTPFALAMGMANGASLAASSLSPPSPLPPPPQFSPNGAVNDHRMNRERVMAMQDFQNPDKINRRCCV